MERATFGCGCYWGVEHLFRAEFGANVIVEGSVGFMGGTCLENPGYKAVCTGSTGHTEVFSFSFDPSMVLYAQLVEFFFRIHDSTALRKKGRTVCQQYASAIFYHTDRQRDIAEEYIQRLTATAVVLKTISPTAFEEKFRAAFGSGDIVTEVRPAQLFFPAHDAHQHFLDKNTGVSCSHRRYF